MIREAQIEDIPRMVEMGQRFRKESSYAKHLRDNPEKLYQLGEQMVSARTALVVERDGRLVGMILYYIFDHFMSGDKIAIEAAWWVDPEYRGEGIKLLIQMKRHAKEAGCKFYQMIAPNYKVSNFYKSIGMHFVESAWQGEL